MRTQKTTTTLLFAMASFLVLAGWAVPTRAGESQYEINIDKPTKGWREGPVRYIITKEEDKAYKRLKEEQDRANFIDIFWRRRDPTPGTEFNEFKHKIWVRSLDANQLYAQTSTPGWKTDRGKIYILVGPPDEMVRDRVARSHRGTILWIYRAPPFPDLPPNTVIAFAKNVQGEYMLSARPTFDSDVAHGLQFMGDKPLDPDFNLPIIAGTDPLMLSQGVSVAQGAFETAFIYSRMQQLPPKDAKLLKDLVIARSSFEGFPFESRFSFFKTDSAKTLVAISLGIKSTSVQFRLKGGREVPDVRIFGKLLDQDNPEHEIPLSSDDYFAPGPGNDTAGIADLLVFQAMVPAEPGRYLAIFAAEDKVSGKVATYREPVIIPDLTGSQELTLSTVTLADSIRKLPPVEDAADAPRSPFALGAIEVVQSPDTDLRPEENLNFYYQIYNVQKDPATGQPNLDIVYEYIASGVEGDISLGKTQIESTPSQAQAYSLPLGNFPTAEYRLRITVTDKVAGTTTSQELQFSIVP